MENISSFQMKDFAPLLGHPFGLRCHLFGLGGLPEPDAQAPVDLAEQPEESCLDQEDPPCESSPTSHRCTHPRCDRCQPMPCAHHCPGQSSRRQHWCCLELPGVMLVLLNHLRCSARHWCFPCLCPCHHLVALDLGPRCGNRLPCGPICHNRSTHH